MKRIDSSLVEAARGGASAALDRLLSVLQPDLMRCARRTCRNAPSRPACAATSVP